MGCVDALFLAGKDFLSWPVYHYCPDSSILLTGIKTFPDEFIIAGSGFRTYEKVSPAAFR